MDKGWFGFDLDGTLAYYNKFEGFKSIGRPIPAMIMKLKDHLRRGDHCKILTARAALGKEAIEAIRKWLVNNGLPPLEITDSKDSKMILLYDDRCIHVETNTGRIIG